jgi:hypothetical protein
MFDDRIIETDVCKVSFDAYGSFHPALRSASFPAGPGWFRDFVIGAKTQAKTLAKTLNSQDTEQQ